jgi:hypothetical protein
VPNGQHKQDEQQVVKHLVLTAPPIIPPISMNPKIPPKIEPNIMSV